MKLLLLLLLTVSCTTINSPLPPVVTPVSPVKTEVAAVKPEPVVYYSTTSSVAWVNELVKTANCVVNNEDFIKEVSLFPKYEFTESTPAMVAEAIRAGAPATVRLYTTKLPWSKAIATTFSGDKVNIYLNTRKHPRPMPAMINTLVHERLHLLGFSHGDDNYAKGKENSVNYKAGELSEKYSSICK